MEIHLLFILSAISKIFFIRFTYVYFYVKIWLYTVGGECSYKNYRKGDKIVLDNKNRLLVFLVELISFCLVLLFGIFIAPYCPQLFFWSFVAGFLALIGIELAPTGKDFKILIGEIILLMVAGTIVTSLVSHLLEKHFVLYLIICAILLSPIFFPLMRHFYNMNMKRIADEKEKNWIDPKWIFSKFTYKREF